jgi:methyl-accepting chemotaxis protein
VGNIVACFNHIEKRACFISFPELAATERSFFEMVWKSGGKLIDGVVSPQSIEQSQKTIDVPLSTRIFSALREFFLSRKGLAAMAFFLICSVSFTISVFRYNQRINADRIRERLLSIVATGALQFNTDDLNQIRTREDIDKPEYRKIIATMNRIRSQNGNVKYMYILRPTEVAHIFEFVADADSIDPDYMQDHNNDGLINAADENIPPGQRYNAYQIEVLQNGLIERPVANPHSYTDQWGTLLSAFAPIRNESGAVVAVLGVDVFASEATREIGLLKLIFLFIIVFLILASIRFAALGRSLLLEIFDLSTVRGKITIGISGIVIMCLFILILQIP